MQRYDSGWGAAVQVGNALRKIQKLAKPDTIEDLIDGQQPRDLEDVLEEILKICDAAMGPDPEQ